MPGYASFFAISLRSLTFAISLFFLSSLKAQNTESYLNRPDILNLIPMAHPNLDASWQALKPAHLESVVQVLSLYPDYEIYFLARDAELLYDLARLTAQSNPHDAERIHLLNVSRANMRSSHVKDYLAQEGISEANLELGKKILFVDTGFSGTIPHTITSYFPKRFHKQLRTHLLASANSNHPSTRAFLHYLNPQAMHVDPASLHGTIVSYEHMPRYTDRSHDFENIDGKWAPVSLVKGSTDGQVNQEKAVQYQQDLKAYWVTSETKEIFQLRRKLYRELLASAQNKTIDMLIVNLVNESSDVEKGTKTVDVLLLDLDDTLLKEVSVELKTTPGVQALVYTPNPDVATKYKARLQGSSDSGKFIHYEFNGDNLRSYVSVRPAIEELLLSLKNRLMSGSLRVLITSANDGNRTKAVVNQLKVGGISLKDLGLEYVEPNIFLESGGKKSVRKLRESLGIHPDAQILVVDDLTENIVGLGINDRVFKVAAWNQIRLEDQLLRPNDPATKEFSKADAREMKRLELIVSGVADFDQSKSFGSIPTNLKTAIIKDFLEFYTKQVGKLEFYFPDYASNIPEKQNSSGQTGSKKLELIQKYPDWAPILEDPETQIPLLFKNSNWQMIGNLIDAQVDAEIDQLIINFLFDEESSGHKKALQKVFIEKASQYILQQLAIYKFSQPHTEKMPDLIKLVIEMANHNTLQFLAERTFSQPHTEKMPDLIKLVIEKADQATLMNLAIYTFSQPHTKNMADLIKLVIEKADQFTLQFLDEDTFSQPHTKNMAGVEVLRESMKIQDPAKRAQWLKENYKPQIALKNNHAFNNLSTATSCGELLK